MEWLISQKKLNPAQKKHEKDKENIKGTLLKHISIQKFWTFGVSAFNSQKKIVKQEEAKKSLKTWNP